LSLRRKRPIEAHLRTSEGTAQSKWRERLAKLPREPKQDCRREGQAGQLGQIKSPTNAEYEMNIMFQQWMWIN